VCYDQANQLLEVFVNDEGRGVRSEDQERLLRLFSSEDPSLETDSVQCCGLGLVICKKIVKCLGGEISLCSAGRSSGLSIKFTMHMTLTKIGLENVSSIEEDSEVQDSNQTLREILNQSRSDLRLIKTNAIAGGRANNFAGSPDDSDLSLD